MKLLSPDEFTEHLEDMYRRKSTGFDETSLNAYRACYSRMETAEQQLNTIGAYLTLTEKSTIALDSIAVYTTSVIKQLQEDLAAAKHVCEELIRWRQQGFGLREVDEALAAWKEKEK